MGKFAVLLGANWNNGVNSGSRYSNWNNAPSNSNNNIGARGVCDDTRLDVPLGLRHGAAGRPVELWSAIHSRFGKYVARSGRTPSSRKAKGAAGLNG